MQDSTTVPTNTRLSDANAVNGRRHHWRGPRLSLGALAIIGGAVLSTSAHAQTNHLRDGHHPTVVTITNQTNESVYLNLVLGQPPATPPTGCISQGTQIVSIEDPRLRFKSSTGNTVAFTGPPNVVTKGAYQMAPKETITYEPDVFDCLQADVAAKKCTPSFSGNVFFTRSVNGTTTGNNGCGGAGTEYPNATNLAEFSVNFSANGATGAQCPNPDTTDISAVNGVNATIHMAMSGAGWPTASAENGALGQNGSTAGVFGWAATNCTNTAGYPNPSKLCKAPVNAPRAENGSCDPASALITGPDGMQYCGQLNAANTCNNQRPNNVTGGTVAITYKGPIAAYVDVPAPEGIFDNKSAQTICPPICTGANGTWSGQWTNIVSPNVCGCLVSD